MKKSAFIIVMAIFLVTGLFVSAWSAEALCARKGKITSLFFDHRASSYYVHVTDASQTYEFKIASTSPAISWLGSALSGGSVVELTGNSCNTGHMMGQVVTGHIVPSPR